MEVTYLGTGAAEGIPALFCSCPYCEGVRLRGGREIRSRSQVLLDGELSVDFPPDAFYHGALLGAEIHKIRYLLVTHSHMDHFYAHDFILHGYKYAQKANDLDIYGNREVKEVFEECTRRELRADVREHIRLHTLSAYEKASIGPWTAVPLPARHSSESPFVYLLEKDGTRLLHLTDTGPLGEEVFAYLKQTGGAPFRLVTLDGTFLYDKGSNRHMTLEDDKAVMERLKSAGLADKNTKFVITHFSHNSEPTAEKLAKAEREYGVIAAYDGMRLKI